MVHYEEQVEFGKKTLHVQDLPSKPCNNLYFDCQRQLGEGIQGPIDVHDDVTALLRFASVKPDLASWERA
eukprot:11927342-Karenia_brevis.AAC.1